MRASASLLALLFLCLAAAPASGQAVVPIVELSVSPAEQFVNVTSAPVDASFACTVFVEGLPLVRYRVDLTAYCEGWQTRCEPAQLLVTGSTNESFQAVVTVPAGTPASMQHQVEVYANVSTSGLPLNSSVAYALVSVQPVYGLKLTTNATAIAVGAGKSAPWPFTVQNTGNGRDTFGTTVVNSASFPGWTLVCNRTSVSVDTNASFNLRYDIKPPADAGNQTVILQVRAFSRGAAFKNLTVEQKLELEITVTAAPAAANTTKPSGNGKSFLPGAGGPALGLAVALAALVALRRRK